MPNRPLSSTIFHFDLYHPIFCLSTFCHKIITNILTVLRNKFISWFLSFRGLIAAVYQMRNFIPPIHWYTARKYVSFHYFSSSSLAHSNWFALCFIKQSQTKNFLETKKANPSPWPRNSTKLANSNLKNQTFHHLR